MRRTFIYIFIGAALVNVGGYFTDKDWHTGLWALIAAFYAYMYVGSLTND